jgi:hypothetical protein
MDSVYLAADRDQRWSLVNTILTLRVLCKTKNLWAADCRGLFCRVGCSLVYEVNATKCELWKAVLHYHNDHSLFGKRFEILVILRVWFVHKKWRPVHTVFDNQPSSSFAFLFHPLRLWGEASITESDSIFSHISSLYCFSLLPFKICRSLPFEALICSTCSYKTFHCSARSAV